MSRRRRPERRPVIPDGRYHSDVITRLINVIMERGKKSTAERIVYGALDHVAKVEETDEPDRVLHDAVRNASPRLEVKSRRVGGATYQVPIEVSGARQLSLALRWLTGSARSKKGVPMSRALAQEILDASKGQGAVIKKRDDTHKMAQANRAFAHYRW